MLARALLRIALRLPALRRLPRALFAPLERVLARAAPADHFDAAGYLARNPDVREAGHAALDHYLCWGWREGRSPNGWLDDAAWRRQAGLRPGDRISALGSLLAGAGPAGVAPAAMPGSGRDDAATVSAALARLARARPRRNEAPEVDVIVPVYSGRAETLTCLASVLETTGKTRFALVVIDDAGPDPALRADLAGLARRGLVDLVVQPANRGFVAAVNRGMALHPGRDVIWLNADTEVHGDWIDRLRRTAGAAPDIATVTPLTNNGTICSYPRFDTDNALPLEIGWDEVDRIAARVNAGRTVEAPTCVGFATYVRRSAIERVGTLDEAAFGLGYGEENDFSQRALRAGLRNLIAGDVFVRHRGQTAFGTARVARVRSAMRVVEARHPGYGRAVRRFLAEDPVAPLRQAIDLGRLRRGGKRNVLFVTHSRGGGTARRVAEEIDLLAAEGSGAVVMQAGTRPGTVRLGRPGMADLPSLEALPLAGPELPRCLGDLGLTEIRLHHLADFGVHAARRIGGLVARLGLPVEFVVHDYLPICPRINLADLSGMYCGEPGEAGCRGCLRLRRSEFGAPDIALWRRGYAALLSTMRAVRVPDRDVSDRLARYFPGLGNVIVQPHEPPLLPASRRPEPPRRGRVLIAVIGAIGPAKGFDVLLDLADRIRRTRTAADLTVIGYTRNDAAARAAGIRVTGAYREDRVQAEIATADPDLILIPSTWPETYCYTLSHALASGRPVAGFGIGAVGTRLGAAAEAGARAAVLPLGLARSPAALLDALIAITGRSPALGREDA